MKRIAEWLEWLNDETPEWYRTPGGLLALCCNGKHEPVWWCHTPHGPGTAWFSADGTCYCESPQGTSSPRRHGLCLRAPAANRYTTQNFNWMPFNPSPTLYPVAITTSTSHKARCPIDLWSIPQIFLCWISAVNKKWNGKVGSGGRTANEGQHKTLKKQNPIQAMNIKRWLQQLDQLFMHAFFFCWCF